MPPLFNIYGRHSHFYPFSLSLSLRFSPSIFLLILFLRFFPLAFLYPLLNFCFSLYFSFLEREKFSRFFIFLFSLSLSLPPSTPLNIFTFPLILSNGFPCDHGGSLSYFLSLSLECSSNQSLRCVRVCVCILGDAISYGPPNIQPVREKRREKGVEKY